MTAVGGFPEAAIRHALCEVASQIGVTSGDAQLLHLANNAVFALPSAGVVVRIARTNHMHDRVHKVVRLGKWLNVVGAPAIRLLDTVAQPLVGNQLLATVWEYVPPHEQEATVRDLGSSLARWHGLRPPNDLLPMWNPVRAARQRLNDADGLARDDHDFLLAWCDQLEPQIVDLNQRQSLRLVHGDAHLGNLLRRDNGEAIFCDFDSTSIGPPQVDLAAVAAGETWFNQNGLHTALAHAYDYDVTTDPDWPIYRSARELAFVVGGVPLLASSTRVAEEFALRLRSVKERDETTVWTPYAALSR